MVLSYGTGAPVNLFIVNETFSQAEATIVDVAERFVKGLHLEVGVADHDVDFGAAHFEEKPLGVEHHILGVAFSLMIGMDGEVVDLGSVAVVAKHAAGHDRVVDGADKKPLRVDLFLSLDVAIGIVDRSDQPAGPPKIDQLVLISIFVGAELHYLESFKQRSLL